MKKLVFILSFFLSLQGFSQRDSVYVKTSIYSCVYSEVLQQPKRVWYTVQCPLGSYPRKGMDFYTNDSVRTSDGKDYEANVWDKGHCAPAADFNCDRDRLWATFSYLNCVLQHERLNRGVWRLLEVRERELAKQGKFIDAAALAKSINSEYWKSLALITISEQLAKKGLSELSESVVKDAVDCAAGISDYFLKSSALRLISSSLAEKGDITGSSCILEMALDSALHIPTNKEKSQILTEISSVYSKQLKVERAVYVLAEALGSVQKINDELDFDIALSEILFTLIKYGQFDQIKKVIILFKNEEFASIHSNKIV